MTRVLVVSADDRFAEVICSYVRLTKDVVAEVHSVPGRPDDDAEAGLASWVYCTFNCLSQWIEDISIRSGEDCSLRNVIAIVDGSCHGMLATLDNLNPLVYHWSAVIAMLILAYPEIHWVIYAPYLLNRYERLSYRERLHLLVSPTQLADLLTIHEQGLSVLYDPSGLRDSIRGRARDTETDPVKNAAAYIRLRPSIAAAIDEEAAYCNLHAYTAYRQGFKCLAVCTYSMMAMLSGASPLCPPDPLRFVFEDLYLSFPDSPPDVHLSDLRSRDSRYPRLVATGCIRVIVTVGHGNTASAKEIDLDNKQYMKELADSRQIRSLPLPKPVSGIFDLWASSNLADWLAEDVNPRDAGEDEMVDGSHSAPGRLLAIANGLINRAERILHSAQSVPDAVHGALLALEAKEYLSRRTPTTWLEALALQHQLEVTAECMFYGVAANLEIRKRLAELKSEIDLARRWFGEKTGEQSVLNARLGIVNRLAQIFQSYGQFEEEQECLVAIRELSLALSRSDKRVSCFSIWPRWYVEQLLTEPKVFIAAIVLWLLLFTNLFALTCDYPMYSPGWAGHTTIDALMHALVDAVTSFIGIQPPHEMGAVLPGHLWTSGIAIAAMIIGFLHLGILVSYIYTLVSRK